MLAGRSSIFSNSLSGIPRRTASCSSSSRSKTRMPAAGQRGRETLLAGPQLARQREHATAGRPPAAAGKLPRNRRLATAATSSSGTRRGVDHQVVLGRGARLVAEEIAGETLPGAVHLRAAGQGLLRRPPFQTRHPPHAPVFGGRQSQVQRAGLIAQQVPAPRPTRITLPRRAASAAAVFSPCR